MSVGFLYHEKLSMNYHRRATQASLTPKSTYHTDLTRDVTKSRIQNQTAKVKHDRTELTQDIHDKNWNATKTLQFAESTTNEARKKTLLPPIANRTGGASKQSIGASKKSMVASSKSLLPKSGKKGLKKKPEMAVNYGSIQRAIDQMVSRLAQTHCGHNHNAPLNKQLIRSVVAFVQMLSKYRDDMIDEDAFIALFADRFGMVSYSFNQEIFSVFAKGLVADSAGIQDASTVCGLTDTNSTISAETLAGYLCALLTDNHKFKAEVVFSVLDHSRTNKINRSDILYNLVPVFKAMDKMRTTKTYDEDDDPESEEKEKEFFISTIMGQLGMHETGEVNRQDFVAMAQTDPSRLNFFSPLIPAWGDVKAFREVLENKTPFQVKYEFRTERKKLLKSMESGKTFIQSLYPVELENL